MANRLKRRKKRREARRQLLLPLKGQDRFILPAIRLHFKLLPYWQAAAERNGYDSPKVAILGIFRETGSIAETARRLTFSRAAVRDKLLVMREPMPGRPGGQHNFWGQTGKPKQEDVLS